MGNTRWTGMTREELEKEIDLCRQALMFAGPIHIRDLQKHIKRMEKELMMYDRNRESPGR